MALRSSKVTSSLVAETIKAWAVLRIAKNGKPYTIKLRGEVNHVRSN